MTLVKSIVKTGPISNVELIEKKKSGWNQYRVVIDDGEFIVATSDSRTTNCKELENGDVVDLVKGVISAKLNAQTYIVDRVGRVEVTSPTMSSDIGGLTTQTPPNQTFIEGVISEAEFIKVDDKSGYAKYIITIDDNPECQEAVVGLKAKHVNQGITLKEGMNIKIVKYERGYLVADESFNTNSETMRESINFKQNSNNMQNQVMESPPTSNLMKVIANVEHTEVPNKGYDIYNITFEDGSSGKVFSPPREFTVGSQVEVEDKGNGRIKVFTKKQKQEAAAKSDSYAERLNYERSEKDPEIAKRGWSHIFVEILKMSDGNFDLAEDYIAWVDKQVGSRL